MKTLDNYTYNQAVNEVFALEEMGVLECAGRWDNPIHDYLPEGVECYEGCTRMCFKLETLPGWVIKVDFKETKGYCKREADNYADAEEFGIQDCFASTYRLTELDDGRVVIIQEACSVNEDAVTSEWYDYVARNSSEFIDDEHAEDPDYIWDAVSDLDTTDRLYAIFGDEKRFNVIDNFCYDNQINDIHEGNWGWTAEGNLVLIDFAGYGCL